MMIVPLGAHNGVVDCLIRRGTYLEGGALGTQRRALSLRSTRPCDIHLESKTLDPMMPRLSNMLHGGWLWSWIHILRRSIGAW